jgi:hypothetical protein
MHGSGEAATAEVIGRSALMTDQPWNEGVARAVT